MSNVSGTKTSREEEIAFLIMEQVLGVDIYLADAGAGNSQPDGVWISPGGSALHGIVEVTSPPDKKQLAQWAHAKREGEVKSESGSMPLRLNELDQVCTEMLGEDWAQGNVAKLVAQSADERHLYLFWRSYRVGDYFYRLSETYEDGSTEPVSDIVLPEGITDVWFEGRAQRDPGSEMADVRVSRFQAEYGWHRYVTQIEERQLPSPNPSIVDDQVPAGWRMPKDRTLTHR